MSVLLDKLCLVTKLCTFVGITSVNRMLGKSLKMLECTWKFWILIPNMLKFCI